MQCYLQVGLSACRKHEVLAQIQTGGGGRREGGGINRARGPQEPRPARAKQNKELPGGSIRGQQRERLVTGKGYRDKSRNRDDLGNESEGIDRKA